MYILWSYVIVAAAAALTLSLITRAVALAIITQAHNADTLVTQASAIEAVGSRLLAIRTPLP
jgi:hypothetical protein